MKYIPTIITAFLLLLALPSVSPSDAGIEWDILNQESMELYRTGQYDRAVVVAKKALEVAEKNVGPNHPDVATSLNNLALLYHTQGQYASAEPLYKRALTINEKALVISFAPYAARGSVCSGSAGFSARTRLNRGMGKTPAACRASRHVQTISS